MPHIDRDTYGSFVFTSLLYLNTMREDFEVRLASPGPMPPIYSSPSLAPPFSQGGGFVFLDGPEGAERRTIIEPHAGRVSFFTSGEENKHHVAKVTAGVRYAITVSFTCSREAAIKDPTLGTA